MNMLDDEILGVKGNEEFDRYVLEKRRKEVEEIVEIFIENLQNDNILSLFISIEQVKDKLMNIVQRLVIEDLHNKERLGYWGASAGIIGIDETLKNAPDKRLQYVHTIIHELLHALSTTIRNGIQWSGIKKSANDRRYMELGRGLNEGITEYLVQQICPTAEYLYDKNGISFNIAGPYPMEQIMIKQLALLYGDDKIVEAYLNNHDINMPHEEYLELRENFDCINNWKTQIREISRGRRKTELSEEEHSQIAELKYDIAELFKQSQQFFLESCLAVEIEQISTLEEAEELSEKIRKLNSLNIKIEGNEKANYRRYVMMFAKKYVQIVNQNRNSGEQIRFEDMIKTFGNIGTDDSPPPERTPKLKRQNSISVDR